MTGFHIESRRRPFFEGWYFKQQSDSDTVAFIPGIQLDSYGNRSAFVQTIMNRFSHTKSYPYEAFSAHKDELFIRVDNNEFSASGINIDIEDEAFACKGRITYGPLTPLGKDCMGPFRFLPFMECSHKILSMGHGVFGHIEVSRSGIPQDSILFDKGSSGYLEMDYGSSFPKEYSWVQCNRFSGKDCSILATAATIPILGTTFCGTTCVVRYYGETHSLASFLGARVKTNRENRLVVEQGQKRLEIDVIQDNHHPLQAPLKGSMSRVIHESPQCRGRFLFTVNDKILIDLTSSQASFEYVRP
jgi:tocopherol cyclase